MIAIASADCTMRMGNGHTRRVAYPIADTIGKPTITAPQARAARAFSQRRDGRRHHRDAGGHTERDDVLRLAHADAPPRRCTVAPAGKGPWAGLPTTAHSEPPPDVQRCRDHAGRGPSTSAVESSTAHRRAGVVGHPRRT